jgi:hypothetical protein
MPRKLTGEQQKVLREAAEEAKKEGMILVSALAEKTKVSRPAVRNFLIREGFLEDGNNRTLKARPRGPGVLISSSQISKLSYEGLRDLRSQLLRKLTAVEAKLVDKLEAMKADAEELRKAIAARKGRSS